MADRWNGFIREEMKKDTDEACQALPDSPSIVMPPNMVSIVIVVDSSRTLSGYTYLGELALVLTV